MMILKKIYIPHTEVIHILSPLTSDNISKHDK